MLAIGVESGETSFTAQRKADVFGAHKLTVKINTGHGGFRVIKGYISSRKQTTLNRVSLNISITAQW